MLPEHDPSPVHRSSQVPKLRGGGLGQAPGFSLGLDRAQAVVIVMKIKATRTKTVAVFMLALTGLNSRSNLYPQ